MIFLNWCSVAHEQRLRKCVEVFTFCLWRSWLAPPCGQEKSECDMCHSVSNREMAGVPLLSSVVWF